MSIVGVELIGNNQRVIRNPLLSTSGFFAFIGLHESYVVKFAESNYIQNLYRMHFKISI